MIVKKRVYWLDCEVGRPVRREKDLLASGEQCLIGRSVHFAFQPNECRVGRKRGVCLTRYELDPFLGELSILGRELAGAWRARTNVVLLRLRLSIRFWRMAQGLNGTPI
jgi:hypothetical protein